MSDVEGFDAAWLALREPLDRTARDADLTRRLADWIDARRTEDKPGPCVVDLGCGLGSNLRYLMPSLGHDQRWRLVDDDPALLDAVPAALEAWCVTAGLDCTRADDALEIRGPGVSASVRTERLDLAHRLDELALRGVDLVTASALLDLCSAPWIESLVEACERAAGLFVLDYDGSADWTPAHPDDAAVREFVNRHQLRDKGFGPALGPGAGGAVAAGFAGRGHAVSHARSVWRIDASTAALHAAYVAGWARAAREIDPAFGARIDAWLEHRLHHVESAGLEVGHHDMLALPPA